MSEEIVRPASFFFSEDSESSSDEEEVAMEKEANVKSTSSSSPVTTSGKGETLSRRNKISGSESDDFVMENTYDDEAEVETKTDANKSPSLSSSGNQNEKSSFVLRDGGSDIVIEERKERRDTLKPQKKKPQKKKTQKRKERRDPMKPQKKKNHDKKFWKGYVFMETDPETFKTEEFCVIDQDDTMIKYCSLEPIANCENSFYVRKENIFDDKNIRRVRIARRSEMIIAEKLWNKEQQERPSMVTTTSSKTKGPPKVSKNKTKTTKSVFPMRHVLLPASYSPSSSSSSKIQEKAAATTTSASSKIQEKATTTTTTSSAKTSSSTKTPPKEATSTKTKNSFTTKVTPRRYVVFSSRI